MRKRDRPIPFPQWSAAWKQYIRDALKFKWAKDYHEARAQIAKLNYKARQTPLPGERCGTICKQSKQPCKAKANQTGRCYIHGGTATRRWRAHAT